MKTVHSKKILKTSLLILGLGVLFFVMGFPFFYMIASSIKKDTDIFTQSIFYFPITHPNWNNYVRVWTEIDFPLYILNTVKVTLLATLLQLAISSLAAYAFAKMDVPAKNLIFSAFIATMMVPWTAIMIPQFVMISRIGLYNTHAALIILQAFSAFGIFLLRQFFMGIPNELSEAAKLDGCGHLRFLTRIVIPLSKAAYSALIIFTFIKVWNDYLAPLIYLQSDGKRTIQLGLSLFRSQYSMDYGVIMAGTVCSLIPVVIFYAFFQKQITAGITFTGMKN